MRPSNYDDCCRFITSRQLQAPPDWQSIRGQERWTPEDVATGTIGLDFLGCSPSSWAVILGTASSPVAYPILRGAQLDTGDCKVHRMEVNGRRVKPGIWGWASFVLVVTPLHEREVGQGITVRFVGRQLFSWSNEQFTTTATCLVLDASNTRQIRHSLQSGGLSRRGPGDITIGPGTLVHPKAVIFAFVIGAGCIIEEAVIIVNHREDIMRIGDNNLFEIGCRVECPSIGGFNTISSRARVHNTMWMTNHCVIGVQCLVVPAECGTPDEYTCIYGPAADRRTWSGRGQVQGTDLPMKHAEHLCGMLPNFNRLRRYDGA
ncbi:hypothetical protein EDD15DRAFT_2517031 [Pisolithus albus]|nr:hypothetical protein EDD15DRAFT_2517031 [Pisolithus albus]